MDEHIITWNVANWVSVTLMALLGYFIVATITGMIKGKPMKEPSLYSQQAD